MRLLRLPILLLLSALGLAAAALWPGRATPPPAAAKAESLLVRYVTIADGVAGEGTREFGVRKGAAVFSMKAWATSTTEAANLAGAFARRADFQIHGGIEVYKGGDITSPARGAQYGYAMKFYPYDSTKP